MSASNNQDSAKDVAESLGKIIRHSFNEDFRNECFRLLNVDNSQGFEVAVHKKLTKISKSSKKLQEVTISPNYHIEKSQSPGNMEPTAPEETLGSINWKEYSKATKERHHSSSSRSEPNFSLNNRSNPRFKPYSTLGEASLSSFSSQLPKNCQFGDDGNFFYKGPSHQLQQKFL